MAVPAVGIVGLETVRWLYRSSKELCRFKIFVLVMVPVVLRVSR
jgi:hypothetical protein